MAMGAERGRLRTGDRVAMLGIGSGINCLMLAVEWQHALDQDGNRDKVQTSLARAAG
jgi:hypothetical protein